MNWLFLAAATTAPTPEPIDVSWQFRQSRPPIVSVSRESAEPPLLDAALNKDVKKLAYSTQPLTKTCLCSPNCVCGCNDGRPCQCKQTNYPGIPDSSQTNTGGAVGVGLILSPASAIHHTPPVRSLVPAMPSFFGRAASMAAPVRNC